MAHSDPDLPRESPLQAAELRDAEGLVREAGWNQVAADWRIFLELGSVYAVRDSAGRVIATAATIPYGGRVAWISMVLVAGDYRGRGIATRLLRRCVDDCVDRRLQPVLDATPKASQRRSWGAHSPASAGRSISISSTTSQPCGDGWKAAALRRSVRSRAWVSGTPR
jgi:GNAT superfamily N-acetyltransferase